MTSSTFDVIVVGVGGMGSAACWQLARRGLRVLGLERFSIPNARGSSHGSTRIIRLAYHEGSAYVPLVSHAFTLWRETEKAFGEQLVFTTGSLDAGPVGCGFVKGALDACEDHGLPHELLSGAEINTRFPGIHLPTGHHGLFQPDGGFIACERAIVAHVALARAAGAEIHANERVLEWATVPDGGVRVVTDRGRYEAGRLVLSAGAWIGELVPALAPFTISERQVVGWFQPIEPQHFAPDVFPATILDVEEGPYYAVPMWGEPGLKAGLHGHVHERGSTDAVSREPNAEDEAIIRLGLSRYFPAANGPLIAMRRCIYTMTPDEHFIIDTLPDQDEVIVASPCSGHGYKFAPVVGEIVADLATEKRSAFDLSMFRLGRFEPIAA